MKQQDGVVHFAAGGVAGSVGALITCPLEVIKTRLQSSSSNLHFAAPKIANEHQTVTKSMNLIQNLRQVVKYEGPKALYKGIGPQLAGVIPARSIYFYTYSKAKQFFNSLLPPNTPIVHMCSASVTGFVTTTCTNPIWFVKTRLQLHNNKFGHMTIAQCIRKIYSQSGIFGFYKGITASYMGIAGTMVYFVIYEAAKAKLIVDRSNHSDSNDFMEFMVASGISKMCASCLAYPYEVARTRLREEGNIYHSFWQTISLVFREEGVRGIYGGFTTQLIRQIPNSAIIMATYETLVVTFSSDMK